MRCVNKTALAMLLVAWCMLMAASVSRACGAVHFALPTKTLADKLLEAKAVVLAREHPRQAFRYAIVEVLQGQPDPVAIDLFLPSMHRRILSRFPDRSVLLTQSATGSWSALGVADSEYARVVRLILSQAPSWKPMETDNRQRITALAPLLGHPDRRLHELAYLEIERGPYGEIRRLGKEVSREVVRQMLDQPVFSLQWQSLAILMLPQSGLTGDHERIANTLDEWQQLGIDLNLAAWATAYLDIEGATGLHQIQQWYGPQTVRTEDELRAIVKAISVSANEIPDLRDPAVESYLSVLSDYPFLSDRVIADLIHWQRWDLVPRIQVLRQQVVQSRPKSAFVLDRYLLAARSLQAEETIPRF